MYENEIKWAQKAGGGPSVSPKSANALLNSRHVPSNPQNFMHATTYQALHATQNGTLSKGH